VRGRRGFTLIEAMVAMSILLVGALGMMALHGVGMRMNSEAREVMRAAAIASDVLGQINGWEYDDPRLANANTANDGDLADGALAFEAYGSTPPFDFDEASLALGGRDWNGIPTAQLAVGGFERFWNVSEADDANANGLPDGRRVAVLVRWLAGGRYHRVVLLGFKVNPVDRL